MKHIKKILALALAVLSLMAVALPAMAAPNLTGDAITTTNVNMRRSGSISADLICTLSAGASVRIITTAGTNGWYYVQENKSHKVNGEDIKHYGYINEPYLKASSTSPTNQLKGYGLNFGETTSSIGDYVNVRGWPTNGTVYGQLMYGDYVIVYTDSDHDGYRWYNVECPAKNIAGFVRGDYLAGTYTINQ